MYIQNLDKIVDNLEPIAKATFNYTSATLLLTILTALVLQALYDLCLRKVINRRTTYKWLDERWEYTKMHTVEMLSHYYSIDEMRIKDAIERIHSVETEKLLEDIGFKSTSAVFNLSFQQLCAQLSGALLNAVDLQQAPATCLAFSSIEKSESNIDSNSKNQKNPFKNKLKWAASLIFSLNRYRQRLDEEDLDENHQITVLRVERGIDELQSELERVWGRSAYIYSFIIAMPLFIVLLIGAHQLEALKTLSFIVLITIVFLAALLTPRFEQLLGKIFNNN